MLTSNEKRIRAVAKLVAGGMSIEDVAQTRGIRVDTVRKYLRAYTENIVDAGGKTPDAGREKKQHPAGKCVRCGKNKGVNRWYCPSCHSAVSRGYDLEMAPLTNGGRAMRKEKS